MRVTLAQINPRLGDIDGNIALFAEAIDEAIAEQSDLIVFPELALTGYPPRDLLLFPDFRRKIESALANLLSLSHEKPIRILVGAPLWVPEKQRFTNSALGLYNGDICYVQHKTLLPYYDIFDDRRYFIASENEASFWPIGDTTVGVLICEDAWAAAEPDRYIRDPLVETMALGVDFLVVVMASPYEIGKPEKRQQHFQAIAQQYAKPVVMVNQVGAHDDMIFDGSSLVVAPSGDIVAAFPPFQTQTQTVDLGLLQHASCGVSTRQKNPHLRSVNSGFFGSRSLPDTCCNSPDLGSGAGDRKGEGFEFVAPCLPSEQGSRGGSPHGQGNPDPCSAAGAGDRKGEALSTLFFPNACLPSANMHLESIYAALVFSLREYVSKTGFSDVVLGLSGGIDSALTAAIAVDALGAAHVIGVAMPSRYSSPDSLRDAETLAVSLGIAFETIEIDAIHHLYESVMPNVFDSGLAAENVQPRIRGNLLMGISNRRNALLLSTGNKSEIAMGYCTLYGDMCGALCVLGDVYKTEVFALSEWRNKQGIVVPENTMKRPPSAELRPDQTDQDSLPPYAILDAILRDYFERREVLSDLEKRYDPAVIAWVLTQFHRNEYKRRQAAVIPRLRPSAFGPGYRMPIVGMISR
jgi:NAD+ synthase (glutamine-hydrolysing)